MKHMVTAPRHSLDQLLEKDIEGIIIGIEGFAQRSDALYTPKEITPIIKNAKRHHKTVWLNCNALFHEPDLTTLENVLNTIKTLDFDGLLFADLAVYSLAEKLGFTDRLIYYPETYITNPQDLDFWQKQAIKSAVLARELPLDAIETTAAKTAFPLTLFGHGYVNMFHSKRRLLKTFFDYTNSTADPTKKTYTIKEELRESTHPIYQDTFGTHIFREKPMASFNVYSQLVPLIDYLIIDSLLIDETRFLTIVDDYIKIQSQIDIDIASYSDHDDGFFFKKTIYQQAKETAHHED